MHLALKTNKKKRLSTVLAQLSTAKPQMLKLLTHTQEQEVSELIPCCLQLAWLCVSPQGRNAPFQVSWWEMTDPESQPSNPSHRAGVQNCPPFQSPPKQNVN